MQTTQIVTISREEFIDTYRASFIASCETDNYTLTRADYDSIPTGGGECHTACLAANDIELLTVEHAELAGQEDAEQLMNTRPADYSDYSIVLDRDTTCYGDGVSEDEALELTEQIADRLLNEFPGLEIKIDLYSSVSGPNGWICDEIRTVSQDWPVNN